MVKEAKAKLVQITKDQNKYSQLLSALIVQVSPCPGLCTIMQAGSTALSSPALSEFQMCALVNV